MSNRPGTNEAAQSCIRETVQGRPEAMTHPAASGGVGVFTFFF